MTGTQWTIDDDGTLWFDLGDGGALEPWEALPGTHRGQVEQPHFNAAYDALVADVAAARLVDDMTAVVRRYDAGWRPYQSVQNREWWWVRPDIRSETQRMSPGEVAALHHARQPEGT